MAPTGAGIHVSVSAGGRSTWARQPRGWRRMGLGRGHQAAARPPALRPRTSASPLPFPFAASHPGPSYPLAEGLPQCLPGCISPGVS